MDKASWTPRLVQMFRKSRNKSIRGRVQAPMLEVRRLTKLYSGIPAVNDVSFTVRPGQILGYLGPNGSGKSTTVKVLTGLLEATEGEVLYQGQSIRKNIIAFKSRLGYVPEEAHLYQHVTGREYLQLVGRLRGLPRTVIDDRADALLNLFGLSGARYSLIGAYSKGMRQKVLIAAALLHNPEVLIFDEPFSGLDVIAGQVLKALLKKLAGGGKVILYSSHVLEVVEKVCSEVLILRKGRVVAHDSITKLRELMASPSLEDVFSQLAQQDDADEIASQILGVMHS